MRRGIVSSSFVMPPPSLKFQGAKWKPDLVSGGAPNYTKSWINAPIGDPNPLRTVVLMQSFWSGGNRNQGIAARINGQPMVRDYHGGTTYAASAFFRAVVPTGTTATLEVDNSDNSESAFAVWTYDKGLVSLGTVLPEYPVGTTGGTFNNPYTENGSFILGGFTARSGAFTTVWTGATERYDNGISQPSSGADATTTGPNHSVTITTSVPITNQTLRPWMITYRPAAVDAVSYLGNNIVSAAQRIYTLSGAVGYSALARTIHIVAPIRGTQAVTSIKVGGVTAIIDKQTAKPGAADVRILLARAQLPAGHNGGDIVLEFPANVNAAGLMAWSGPPNVQFVNTTQMHATGTLQTPYLLPSDYVIGGMHGQASTFIGGLFKRLETSMNTFPIIGGDFTPPKEGAVGVSATLGAYSTVLVGSYRIT